MFVIIRNITWLSKLEAMLFYFAWAKIDAF